jgi:hypothetical protein
MNKKITKRLFAALAVAMFFIGGVFAQIDITIYESDGSTATGAILYTINSSDVTDVTTVATDGGAGDGDAPLANGVINITPTASTNYLISNAGATQWSSYSPPAVPANITIYLNASYAETIQDYAANRTNDKITINKTMPFWVFPSPIHNPSWAAPAGNYESAADINTDLVSTFAWTVDGAPVGGETDNYTEVSWATTGTKTITVQETADAAYGGCAGNTKNFFTTVIDVPYLEWTNAVDNLPNYTVGGGAAGLVILSECESVATTINPTISNGDNTNEEYPWYIRMGYTVHNGTIAGNDITLGVAQTMPAAVDIKGDITPANTIAAANPLILDGTIAAEQFDGGNEYSFLAAPTAFPTVNNNITVYRFDLSTANGGGYNAKISRKSDYVAFRNAEVATPGSTDNTDWTDSNFSWYENDNGGANRLIAYIVILPAPKTGPIYHIDNEWAL